MIKSFLEGFQFVGCKLGLLVGYYLHGVHYLWKRVGSWSQKGKELAEFSFSSTSFLTVSMFSSMILVLGGPGRLEEETSPEAINLLITLEKA